MHYANKDADCGRAAFISGPSQYWLFKRCGCVLEATGEAEHLLAPHSASASEATSLCSSQACGIRFEHGDYIVVRAHWCYNVTFWFLFDTGWRQRIQPAILPCWWGWNVVMKACWWNIKAFKFRFVFGLHLHWKVVEKTEDSAMQPLFGTAANLHEEKRKAWKAY